MNMAIESQLHSDLQACEYFSVFYTETYVIKSSICSDWHPRERIASSVNNGIQARFEEDCSREGMPEVPLRRQATWIVREKRYYSFV